MVLIAVNVFLHLMKRYIQTTIVGCCYVHKVLFYYSSVKSEINILIDLKNCSYFIQEKTIDYFSGKSVVLTAEQKSSVHVSIVHADILTSDCAAMINTVGKNFDLTCEFAVGKKTSVMSDYV